MLGVRRYLRRECVCDVSVVQYVLIGMIFLYIYFSVNITFRCFLVSYYIYINFDMLC